MTTLGERQDREFSCKEDGPFFTGCCGGIFTLIAVMVYLFHFVDHYHCDAKFSIQSIAVSPSSATWNINFLVKNPNSSFIYIDYGSDETEVRLGPSNAAVLSTYHERKSPSHTAFSVDFVAQGNPNEAVFEQLHIKLRAKHKSYDDVLGGFPGHVDIMCYNPTRSHGNVDKIHCHSSFTKLNMLSSGHHRHSD